MLKSSLLLLVIVFGTKAFCQSFISDSTIFSGITSSGTPLYSRPMDKDSFKVDYIPLNSLVFLYGYIQVNDRFNPNWFIAIYNGKTGYVRQMAISVNHEKRWYLERKKDSGLDARLSFAQKHYADDSITKQRKQAKYKSDVKKAKDLGLALTGMQFPSDEYSVDFALTIFNLNKKTIKYAWFTVNLYNPVKDLIGTKTVKGVGPIEYGNSGNYEFENVLFTKIFEYGRLTKVRIQYMDGTYKEYIGATLQTIIIEPLEP